MSGAEFPNRPTHPDFWVLSDIVTTNDLEVEHGGQTIPDRIRPFADMASVEYIAVNRAGKALQVMRLPDMFVPLLAASWLDGFAAGAAFQQRKEQHG